MLIFNPSMMNRIRIGLSIVVLFSWLCCQKAAGPAHQYKMEEKDSREAAFQKYPDALYPIRKKDKWGYMNRKGEVVLDFQWSDATDFYEGLAKVAMVEGSENRYGFIDAKGAWRVQPVYETAGDFSEGLAMVKRNGKCGFIDLEGKEVITCRFEDAGPFSDGFAAIKQNGWTGFINREGVVVVEPAFTINVQFPRFRQGMAPVFGADEQTGFIDTTGQWAISAQFHSAGNFTDGLAWAMWEQDDAAAEHGFTIKGGYIDTAGVYVIPPEYDFGWDFAEGLATVWVRSEDKTTKIWKVIDREGQVLLDNLPYRNVGAMHDGLIPIQDEQMQWGFMDKTGKTVIAPQYAGINHFRNGLARMEAGTAFSNTLVYINPGGEVVWAE